MTIYTLTTYGPREWLCRIGLLPGELEFRPKRILVSDIQRVVARYFHISVETMKGERRTREICIARHVAMYLSHNFAQQSTQRIGRFFNRDHSTVIHAIQQVEKRKAFDPGMASNLRKLERELRG